MTMNHRGDDRDDVDCSTSPTPDLVASFHTRVAPPAPFSATLAA
jgi:hypothetical protein